MDAKGTAAAPDCDCEGGIMAPDRGRSRFDSGLGESIQCGWMMGGGGDNAKEGNIVNKLLE